MIFNNDYKVPQFCDGFVWRAMGRPVAPSTPTVGAFNFTDQTDVALSSTRTTDPAVTLGGGFTNMTADCNAGCTDIARNGIWAGALTLAGFNSGDTIAIRQTSSASNSTVTTATVTVGPTTSGFWSVTTLAGGACGGTLGAVCADGSVYAGLTPDGDVAMYTTPADSGTGICWNNCNTSGYVDTMVNCTGVETSCWTGIANSALLITVDSDSVTAGTQPHQAAQLCEDLVAHGQSDWHLPALDELNVLWTNRVAIGGFDTSGVSYRSSSESGPSYAWIERFSNSLQSNNVGKSYDHRVRCARR